MFRGRRLHLDLALLAAFCIVLVLSAGVALKLRRSSRFPRPAREGVFWQAHAEGQTLAENVGLACCRIKFGSCLAD